MGPHYTGNKAVCVCGNDLAVGWQRWWGTSEDAIGKLVLAAATRHGARKSAQARLCSRNFFLLACAVGSSYHGRIGAKDAGESDNYESG
jgi:hypothetical protein